ncbi:tetratricopeptide repeat protein [Phycisphaerales bacterium AB-hyl4]|uniref:Tetratricopeptide repeat protein n=1 Tax=Natronomicrosphaera hydrolytica TaxID=3242702 RepID=A0ABV4U3Y1_9BACT
MQFTVARMGRPGLRRWVLAWILSFCVVMPAAAHPGGHAGMEPGPPDDEEIYPPGDLATEHQQGPALSEQIERAPLVDRLLDDPIISDEERRQLKIFHGRWDDLPDEDELTPDERASLAVQRFELNHPSLADEQVEPMLRARAALHRGEPSRVIELLEEADSVQAAVLRAQAHEQRGELNRATNVLRAWQERAPQQFDDPAEQTAAARALVMLAQLEGRPARDYQVAMNQLADARQRLDPLYWPAHLTEAELLMEKDNRPDAVEALLETLALNPRSSEAWYRLGRMSARGFNFDGANEAIDALRQTNDEHLLADLLEVHMRLVQREPHTARETLHAALERYPEQRELIALAVAVESMAYDDDATAEAMARHDELSPGSPLGPLLAGEYLSLARQYDMSERMLREALNRQSNATAPRIELGLMLMQAGDIDAARRELALVTRMDPFNRRANNTLQLAEELLQYETIETDHFIIRYKQGIDEVLARDMPERLEQIHEELVALYGHAPDRKTQIDIMPDEQWFGVRITGMPEIWTIGAATGPVISITPPREGARQRGTFDWPNVLRHEYVHTLNLSQTNNRVPHWFTEACAVAEEYVERNYSTAQLLAWALHEDELFTLETINWGFVRPRTPRDRPLAYAQAHWMHEFIVHRFGHDAIVDMLNLHAKGVEDVPAIEQVTGLDGDGFMSAFRQWAHDQVRQWGLAQHDTSERLRDILAGRSEPESSDELSELLDEHPRHPELLLMLAHRAIDSGDPAAARRAVMRYADARPVDPWSYRMLVELSLELGRDDEAVAALTYLDQQELQHGRWAHQLAQIHRRMGNLDTAGRSAERALQREPYNGTYRELAATIHMQRGDMQQALHHLQGLALLEPTRATHQVRLAALYARVGDGEASRRAAEKAREIDPASPVDRFLESDD